MSLSERGKKDSRRVGLLFLFLLILRVCWGSNCFIALWRMVCLLGSSEQHYPWTGEMLWCLGNGRWDDSTAGSTLLHTAVLEGVWHWDGFGFGQCQKAPEGVLGDPNSRDQLMEKRALHLG